MDTLIVDWGSYSLKFFLLKVERKRTQILKFHELVLPDELAADPDSPDSYIIKSKMIHDYLADRQLEVKLIFQYPSTLLTTRYLTLPVNNKKKAELMIPFQLEEELPFPLASIHYISGVKVEGSNSKALVQVAQKNIFEENYNILDHQGILPAVLSTDLSIVQNCAEFQASRDAQFANLSYLMIDLGHVTSKAYFIQRGQVVANHISHIAGKVINDIIAQTYNLPYDEAILYKHENCFLLTDDQFKEVEATQKEFAELMKQVFWPLIQDIRRWILGFRAKTGQNIEGIYLMGGTTQVKNINHFFAHHLGVKVAFWNDEAPLFPTKTDVRWGKDALQPHHAFAISYLMANSQVTKNQLDNLLVGAYNSHYNQNISLHGSSFIFSRIAMVCLILIFGLLIERFAFLKTDIADLDRKLTTLFNNKQKELGLSAKDKRTYRDNPDKILNQFVKRSKEIKREVETLYDAAQIDAISPFIKIGKLFSPVNSDIIITRFSSTQQQAQVDLKAMDAQKAQSKLEQFSKTLQSAALKDLKIKKDTVANNLSASFIP